MTMDHETTEKISNVSMTSLTKNPALAIIEKIDNDTSFLLVELALCCSLATEMIASDPNPLTLQNEILQTALNEC